jgi:hypothetical protein
MEEGQMDSTEEQQSSNSDEREQKRQRSLANLKPFSSEYQPARRGSRKGIPNRATVLKFYMQQFERQEELKKRAGLKRRRERRRRQKAAAQKRNSYENKTK